jgi:hypothetical protein
MDRFLDKFGELVAQIQRTKKESYIFIDANINLLDLDSPSSQNYLNCIFENGLLQGVFKATRFQNNSHTLIDHILFNNVLGDISTGSLVSEVSDHFFSFISTGSKENARQHHKHIVARDFNPDSLRAFKLDLESAEWEPVYASNNIDVAFDSFWDIYNETFNRNAKDSTKMLIVKTNSCQEAC